MAVWQYGLLAIPKKSISSKSGEIPKQLLEKKSLWEKLTGKVTSEKQIFLPNTSAYWKKVNLEINKIEQQIDKLVKKGSWSEPTFLSWKGNGNVDEDNDCHIAINKIRNEIVEFNFRTDLRNVKNIHKFLTGMLKICEENGLVLIDNEKYILEPKLEIIMEKIKKSRAVEFLNDPKRFLDKVISENKNIR